MDWDAAPGVDVELLGTLVPRPSMNLLQEGGGQGGNSATGATLSQLPLAVPSSAGCSFPEPTVTFETKNPRKKNPKKNNNTGKLSRSCVCVAEPCRETRPG